MDEIFENSKDNYLVAPFEEKNTTFFCQCSSCGKSYKIFYLPQKLFWVGLFIPLCLICNLVLFIYCQYYLDHRVEHTKLEEMDYPTEYMRKREIKRSCITIGDDQVNEINELNNIPQNQRDELLNYIGQDNNIPDLQKYRYEFLKQVVTKIVDSHDYIRSHFRKWALRSMGAIIAQSIVVVIVAVLCT